MFRIIQRQKIYDFVVCLALLSLIIALIVFPAESVDAAKTGLALCANVIIPSLFPFFVLSSLVIQTGLASYAGRLMEPVMRPLFNVSGECSVALVLGFIGGYPIGAKTVISLYNSKRCTKSEAERLLAFVNNSGPAFILGAVGAGIFSSGKVGLLLYFAHALASVCVGILFRGWGKNATSPIKIDVAHQSVRPPLYAAFVDAVKSSCSSIINICGFVIFFTVFIRILHLTGFMSVVSGVLGTLLSPLGFDSVWAERLITGLMEISSGVWTLKDFSSQFQGSLAMAAFMLGWAGLSVHCQVLSFVVGSGLKVGTYIFGKFLHGVIAAVFTFLLAKFLSFESPVSSYLATQVEEIAGTEFSVAFYAAFIIAAAALLFFLAAFLFSPIKSGGVRQKTVEK